MLWLLLLIFIHFVHGGISVSNVSSSMPSGDGWWEVEKTTDDAFYKLQHNIIYLRKIDLDERRIHSCYEYIVYDQKTLSYTHSNTFCYPSIVLTGYMKCSTSALYALLSQYPGAIEGFGGKENCAFKEHSTTTIIEYFNTLPRNVKASQIIINGCISPESNAKIAKILRKPNTFYLFILRDYTDWLWSAYNFWCDLPYDRKCNYNVGHWSIPGMHQRSPELFHSMITAEIYEGRTIPSPNIMKGACKVAHSMYKSNMNIIWNFTTISDTLILSSEELELNPRKTWERIAYAIGLNKQHPKLMQFEQVRYNTNSNKGAGNAINSTDYQPGLYVISNFKPVLNSSRSLLNTCWEEDCIWSSVVTGHRYNACNNTLNHSSIAAISEQDVNTAKYLSYYRNISNNYNPIMLRSLKVCKEKYGFEVHIPATMASLDVGTNLRNRYKRKLGSSGVAAALKSNDKPHQLQQLNRVLILSIQRIDRQYVSDLLVFATNNYYHLDVNDKDKKISSPQNTTAENDEHFQWSKFCTTLKNKDTISYAIGAHPKDISIVSITATASVDGKNAILQLKNSPCGDNIVYFDRVIIILNQDADLLAATWMYYPLGANRIINNNEADLKYNWMLWEETALSYLQKGSEFYQQSNNEFPWLWSEESSEMINNLPLERRLIVQIDDVKSSVHKYTLMFTLLNYVTGGSNNNNNDHNDKAKDRMQCAQLVVTMQELAYEVPKSTTNSPMVDADSWKHIQDIAYSSTALVCNAINVLQNKPLQLATLKDLGNTTTLCSSTHQQSTQTNEKHNLCQIRYNTRVYLDNIKSQAILFLAESTPSAHIRTLIEYSTGIYTGSAGIDYNLLDKFPAEEFCGLRMGLIQGTQYNGYIDSTSFQLNRNEMKKCQRGMIRNFQKVILLVTDPFISIWNEYKKLELIPPLESSNARQLEKEKYHHEMVNNLMNITKYYTTSMLNTGGIYEKIIENKWKSENVLLVSYEAMINEAFYLTASDAANGSAVHKEQHHKSTSTNTAVTTAINTNTPKEVSGYENLHQILSFSQLSVPDPMRLECAVEFLDNDVEIRIAKQSIIELYQELFIYPHVICEINKKIEEKLKEKSVEGVELFPFIRLFSHVTC